MLLCRKEKYVKVLLKITTQVTTKTHLYRLMKTKFWKCTDTACMRACLVIWIWIRTLTIRSCVPSEEMMVPLSPTSDGKVWDIQLVTIAMVLSTAPIFNMGTLILMHTHSHTAHTHTHYNRNSGRLSHTVQTVHSSHSNKSSCTAWCYRLCSWSVVFV